MTIFMTQAKLTPEAFKGLAAGATDRREVLNDMMEQLGGRLISYYFSFGESDIVAIFEGPSPESVLSVLVAAAGSGAMSDVRTTVMVSYEDGIEAIKKSGSINYIPPGA